MSPPVSMAVYYTGQRLSFGTNNGNIMTALKYISSTVLDLQMKITWVTLNPSHFKHVTRQLSIFHSSIPYSLWNRVITVKFDCFEDLLLTKSVIQPLD